MYAMHVSHLRLVGHARLVRFVMLVRTVIHGRVVVRSVIVVMTAILHNGVTLVRSVIPAKYGLTVCRVIPATVVTRVRLIIHVHPVMRVNLVIIVCSVLIVWLPKCLVVGYIVYRRNLWINWRGLNYVGLVISVNREWTRLYL
jgi:hypothetical protein